MNASDDLSEQWLPVPGFEGHYEVSDEGHVRSVDRIVRASHGSLQTRPGKVRKPQIDHGGYLRVMLYRDGLPGESWGIHKLVALAFHPEGWFEGADVRHLDGVRTNNIPANVAWGTRSENMQDCIAHGTHHYHSQTECKWGHKLTEDNVYRWKNGRQCRTCSRRRKNESQRNRRQAAKLSCVAVPV